MPTYHVLLHRTGPEWQQGRPLEEQSGWDEHATYLDGLVAGGTVVLGGPFDDETRVVLVVEATSEAAVREALADDPWHGSHLVVVEVEHWTLRLDGRR